VTLPEARVRELWDRLRKVDPASFAEDLRALCEEALRLRAHLAELAAHANEVVKERNYQNATANCDNYTDHARSRGRELKAIERLILRALGKDGAQ
jgi:hypothetical protein